jgi:RNA polymerase sigma-70 factor (ECF subfamily)
MPDLNRPQSMQKNKKSADNNTDAKLLSRIIRKDSDWQLAFNELFERYRADIYHHCLALMKNPADAEDVVQEVFVRFYRFSHQFNGQSSLKTWLIRIAKNQCYSDLRQKQNDQENVRHLGSLIAIHEAHCAPDGYENVDQRVAVINGLNHLKPEVKDILTLRYWLELSMEQISHTLDIGLSASKMRLLRAQQSFIQALD